MEYYSSKCFEKFGFNVSEVRRSGDSNPSEAVLGETQKLHGNSSYGWCLTNKGKHSDVRQCEPGFLLVSKFQTRTAGQPTLCGDLSRANTPRNTD